MISSNIPKILILVLYAIAPKDFFYFLQFGTTTLSILFQLKFSSFSKKRYDVFLKKNSIPFVPNNIMSFFKNRWCCMVWKIKFCLTFLYRFNHNGMILYRDLKRAKLIFTSEFNPTQIFHKYLQETFPLYCFPC